MVVFKRVLLYFYHWDTGAANATNYTPPPLHPKTKKVFSFFLHLLIKQQQNPDGTTAK
jgi:hypothetical protein